MYDRKKLVDFIYSKTTGMSITDEGVRHIVDILNEIQNRMFSVIKDELYYTPDKFTRDRAGQRNSKFVELCCDKNWDYALFIGDRINKETLEKTTIYQDFVKEIKSSSEYISILRDKKLNIIYEGKIK